MLKLVVAAPDKRKVELECDPSSTFAQVKAQIERELGVPPDKQRLLCNGKERKNGAETLTAAGVSAKSKLMLMLAPGYTMPPPPEQSASDGTGAAAAAEAPASAQADAEPEPVELEGELPSRSPEGAAPVADAATAGACSSTATAGGAGAAGGVVHVRHGRNRYHVRVPQGLAAATFGELAEYLSAQMLPRGIPASECRLIVKGKSASASEPLGAEGAAEANVMLLFREGFHVANEGTAWLKEYSAELAEAEVQLEKLAKRISANFEDGGETSVKLAAVGGLVETLKQSVESVRVSEAKLPEMMAFRDRVLAADAKLEELRKGVRL